MYYAKPTITARGGIAATFTTQSDSTLDEDSSSSARAAVDNRVGGTVLGESSRQSFRNALSIITKDIVIIEAYMKLAPAPNVVPLQSVARSATKTRVEPEQSPLFAALRRKAFDNVNDRVSTYPVSFHSTVNVNCDKCSEAGFYYIGPWPADRVQCFDCGLVLKNWDTVNDDPWVEHAKHAFKYCGFLETNKTRRFIEESKSEKLVDLS
jgi:hypothetical protein